jgi:hypothetical protein
MAAPVFNMWNAATGALTAPPAFVNTSAAAGTVKTMLQLQTGAQKIRIVQWAYALNATPTLPIQFELIETGAVFGTGATAGVVNRFNDVTGPASLCAAQANTGFSPTAEGTITATRLLDFNPDFATLFKMQFPQGREPEVNANSVVRIRATPLAAAATGVLCGIWWEE